METQILMPTRKNIALCANEIKNSNIVAFPTETVYGLGANTFDVEAVNKIFLAKGRPSDNPLIVHIHDKAQLSNLVKAVPIKAQKLMNKFMPGALTLVFEKNESISSTVTGGLDTVAVRMPSNQVALSFIKECGVPLCAPSANKSGLPSATKAKHVFDDFNGKIKYILDDGECDIGLESTVIDVTRDIPRLLRAGGITVEQIEQVIGRIEIYKNNSIALSPGMKYKHYCPKAEVFFSAYYDEMDKTIIEQYDKLKEIGRNPVIFALEYNINKYSNKNTYNMGKCYDDYAKTLFSALRKADDDGFDAIIAEGVSSDGIGASIINRMIKSSGGLVI